MAPEPVLLIIDDTPAIRQLLMRAARHAVPHAVVVDGANVAEARAAITEIHLTAIFTDYHLPDGNALDVIALALAAHPPLPVVVLSADWTVADAVQAAGAVTFLPKPIEMPQVFALLTQLIPPPH